MNKISLKFLSNQAAFRIPKQAVEVGSVFGDNLSIKYGRTSANTSPRMINGLGPCVGLGIFTPTKKFLAHSAPEIDIDYDAIANMVAKNIYNIQQDSNCKDEDVSAFIYGGIAYDSANPLSEASCNLVDAIEKGCNLEGVEPTIITGQYGDGTKTRINSYFGPTQITLWSILFDKLGWERNTPLAEIQQVLENFFEYVKLGNNFELKCINGTSNKNKPKL